MHVERGVPHIWSFFESSHGKREHDGVGACVKRALVKEELKISVAELMKFILQRGDLHHVR